jgi:hypothetical protein
VRPCDSERGRRCDHAGRWIGTRRNHLIADSPTHAVAGGPCGEECRRGGEEAARDPVERGKAHCLAKGGRGRLGRT